MPGVIKMKHAFKTPGLREIARRTPYMHDGSIATLEQVVEHYDRGGVVRPSRSDLMKPLGLIGATIALVFISAYGGHEFKWKEVAILSAILVVFSVLVFVKGLTLPFPLCPDFIENCPIR